jgi:hypothetical protein
MKHYAAIGNCPICSQGRRIIAKDDATGDLYVLCEECESEWASPEESRQIETATRGMHKASTFLERADLSGHAWEVFLW